MITEPDAEMIAALQQFADEFGRNWKDELSTRWMNGRDYFLENGTVLHSVRNELGPTWLYDECTIKPAPKAKRKA